MPKIALLIVAAGRGSRAGGDLPKQYQKLAGQAVLTHTLEALARCSLISMIATVIHPDDSELYEAATQQFGDRLLPAIHGAETRQKSVHNGLLALAPHKPDLVLIHDAARPFVDEGLIERVVTGLTQANAVLPAIPVTDTIKQVKQDKVVRTVERSDLYAAQTPQGFTFDLALELHNKAAKADNSSFTDDASLAEWAEHEVLLVKGSADNYKLTTKRDMEMAELLMAAQNSTETRTGSGFDVHRFETGNAVILCGVEIPFKRKLKGHSDADVALHALTDALYGALGAGDIGQHFPPSDKQWKDVASSVFLEHAVKLIGQQGGKIINTDLTIICERPKIAPHQQKMKETLAELMQIEAHRISIKATTTEGLGFTGRSEGIAAQAVATISLPVNRENANV